MKYRILLLTLLMISFVSGQTIGIVGPAADGWPDPATNPNPDIMLTDNGDGTHTIQSLQLSDGDAKFRTGQDWALDDYGGTTFPTGNTLVNDPSANIPVTAGNYDITLDLNANTYTFTSVVSSSCNYTLRMFDSFGDGWNGNTMDLSVNGTVVLDDVGIVAGDPDPSQKDIQFSVSTGDQITTTWNGGGSFPGETSYEILDVSSTVVGSGAQSSITTPIIASCPSCIPPTGLMVSSITATSAQLDWTATTSSETGGYEYVLITDGSTPDDSTTPDGSVGTGITTASLTVLTAQTVYDAYVRAVCSASDISGWSAVSTFETPCLAFTAPFTEDFNANPTSIPDCWSQGAANLEDWLFTSSPSGHIGNNGTLPSSSPSGGGLAYVDDSGAHNIDTRLESPMIDVSGLTVPALSFYFISDNEGDTNVDFRVEVWDGAAWNEVFFSNQNSANADWEEVTVDLSTLTITGNIQLAFIVDENNGTDFDDDVAIDDVSVDEAPSCLKPTNLATSNITADSADLSWDGTATETFGYQYVLITDGSTPDSTTTPTGSVGTGMTMVNLTGLTSNTTYDAYVRTLCASEDSDWSTATTFTTLCSTFVAPFSEDFNANPTSIPDCWSQGAANAEDWEFTDTPTGHIGDNGSFPNSSASGGGFAWVDDSTPHSLNTRLESPLIDVSGLTTPALSFYFISDNEGDTNVDFKVEVWDGAAWNEVFFSNQNSNGAAWEEVIIDLSSLTITGDIQLAFVVDENNGSDFDDDVAIDDVSVDELPSCLNPSGLAASNVTLDSADASWDAVASATDGYLWFLFNSGDDPTIDTPLDSGSTVAGTTTVNFTGLSPATDYDFYVQSDCGTDGTSDLSAVLAFSTLTPGLDCSSALPSTVTAFGDTSQPINFDTTGNPDMSTVPSCEGFDSTEQGFWYEFTTNATSGVTLSLLSGDAGDLEGAIYDSCGGTELFCFADGSSVDFTSDVLVTGLMPSTTYFIQVYTESFAEGAFSLAITDLPACAAPQNLNVTNITTDSADLNWDDVTEATLGFEWFVFAAGDDPVVDTPLATGTVGAGITTIPVTGLTPDTDYDFYVSSDCDANGTSDLAGPESFSTLALPPANDNVCDAIALTVDATSAGDAYTNVGATAQTDEPVPGCFAGGVDQSVWFTFVAPASGAVEVTTDIAGGTFTDTEIALFEAPTDCADLTTFGPDLACDQDGGTTVAFNSIINVTGLTAGDTYYVQVDRWNTATPGTFGIEVIDQTVGTESFSDENFSFYPNPAQNLLNLQTAGQVQEVKVYNMLGQQVMRETPNTVSPSLNVEALQTGSYIMNVTIDGSSENFRFIKE